MKKIGTYSKGEIAKGILIALLATGAFVAVLALPGLAQVLKYIDIKDGKAKLRLRRSVKNLERSGLVKTEKRGEGVYVALTNRGKIEAVIHNFKISKFSDNKTLDGVWKIIMFDIPETKKSARRALNKTLKDMGCYPYQKSVFITPFSCDKEIDFIGNYFGVRKNISILTATKIENDSAVRKYFKL